MHLVLHKVLVELWLSGIPIFSQFFGFSFFGEVRFLNLARRANSFHSLRKVLWKLWRLFNGVCICVTG